MTNRVVLGPLPGNGQMGLRVSKPGYNALSANLQPKQVSFDSRWTRSARVHMTGRVNGDSTIHFGKTFSTPPLVYVVFTDNQGRERNFSANIGAGFITTYKDRVVIDLFPEFYPATYLVVAI